MRLLLCVLALIPALLSAQTTKLSGHKRWAGETDDTGRLARAMKNAEKTGVLELDQRGVFTTSKTLDVTKVPVIRGLGKRLVTIELTTPNAPVFRSHVAAPYERHSYAWSGFTLQNAHRPSSATPMQFGIMFSAGETKDGNGVYWGHFHDLRLHNQFVGMGNHSTGVGASAFWGNSIERVEATGIAYSGFWFGNAGAIGQPYNRFRDIAVLGDGVQQIGGAKAFYGIGIGGVIIESMGLEDWTGNAMTIYGGGVADIKSITTERCRFDGVRILDLADGHFVVGNIDIEKITAGSCHSIVSLYGANTTGMVSGVFGPSGWQAIFLEAGAAIRPVVTNPAVIGN